MLLEGFSRPADGAAGAHAGDEDVHVALGIGPDFLTGGALVGGGVGRVYELAQDDGAGGAVAEGFGLGDGAFHAFGARREHQGGSQGTQKAAALLAHGVGHGEDDFVAFGAAYPGEAHARVAAGGFHDGGAFLEKAPGLGVFNHGQGHAVFYGTAGIKVFQFKYNVRFLAFEALDGQHGGAADKLSKRIVNHNYLM